MAHAEFTVITKAYLPYARVLMRRLRLIDQDAEQYVFLADNVDGYFDPAWEPFQVVTPSEYVGAADLTHLAFQYTAFELCNALRCFAHRYMSQIDRHDQWTYFDSDIYPVRSSRDTFDENPSASIYLTPHILNACPMNLIYLETNILRHGIFNSGWLGIRRSPEAEEFIDWLIARCRNHCFNFYRDTFVDQLWLNLAPSILRGVHIVRHQGANVGYWNLHERKLLENSSGEIEVDGNYLLFLHFSGWDPANPIKVSQHAPQITGPAIWKKVAEAYSKELAEASLPETRLWPYSWSFYGNGEPIQDSDRKRYADQALDGSWPTLDDPFNCPERVKSLRPGGTWGASLKRRLGRIFRQSSN